MASNCQADMNFVTTCGITITGKDESRPEFENFLRILNTWILPAGISDNLQKTVKQAMDKLKTQKITYLKNYTLHRIIKEIVQEMLAYNGEQDTDSAKFYNQLSELLAICEIEQKLTCLQLDQLGNAKAKSGLLRIKTLNRKPVLTSNEVKRLKKLLHERLKADCTDVARFYESLACAEKDSKTMQQDIQLLRGCSTMLPNFIENSKLEIDVKRQKAKYETLVQQQLIIQYYKALQQAAQSTIQLGELLLCGTKLNETWSSLLTIQANVLLLKLKVVSLDLSVKMYNTNVVQAHLKIKHYLDEAVAKVESEKALKEYKLSFWDSASLEIHALLEEYSKLLTTIEKRRWTLDRMPEGQFEW